MPQYVYSTEGMSSAIAVAIRKQGGNKIKLTIKRPNRKLYMLY